jgi:galactokinase
MQDALLAEFTARHGRPAQGLVRAPGRVNLIGEHTDYSEGFVLPMAIEPGVWIAFASLDRPAVELHSATLGAQGRLDLTQLGAPLGGWLEYLRGVAGVLAARGHRLMGWQGEVASDLPVGSGLSSSAAFELALAHVFLALEGTRLDPAALALLAQEAENRWVGVQCGIMDQLACSAGRQGSALLIDCRSLDLRPVPIPAEAVVAILDTGTRRSLHGSAYNERRAQCEAGARHFGHAVLRDVSPEAFERRAGELEPVVRRRCRHVLAENTRTLEAADALEAGDLARVGALMVQSHASLRDDFEVSSPALDAMVEAALAAEGCFGARMTGAGFGGCAVALVRRDAAQTFAESVAGRYCRATGHEPAVFVSAPVAGARVLFYDSPAGGGLHLR